jgi:virginiamycin A acetyltransferase
MAAGTKFIMNGGNHRLTGVSAYPFAIFAGWDGLWEGERDFPSRGDTVVGNDVWIGYDALLMPGVRIGHGAVIAARSVVTSDVPPYTIVGGNPTKVIRSRYDDTTVARMLRLAWWDWPVDAITEAIPLISQADVDALESFGRCPSGGTDRDRTP